MVQKIETHPLSTSITINFGVFPEIGTLTGFNRGGIIAVLPEGALAAFAPIVRLTGPACYPLHGSGYGFTAPVGGNDKVDGLT